MAERCCICRRGRSRTSEWGRIRVCDECRLFILGKELDPNQVMPGAVSLWWIIESVAVTARVHEQNRAARARRKAGRNG